MKTIYPKYFNKFTCIAGNCPDTCCAGWEVVIDKKFQGVYKSSNTPAAKKAVDRMYTDSDGDVCLKLTNGRCPMLNDGNLCEIYIDMGKDALCDVCRIYPRFFKEARGYVISGISLSCPEAARLILEDNSSKTIDDLGFVQNEDDKIYFEIYNHMVKIVEEGKLFNCNFEKLENACDEFIFNKENFDPQLITDCFESWQGYASDYAKKIAKEILNLEILTYDFKNLCNEFNSYVNCIDPKKTEAAFLKTADKKEIKNTAIYLMYKYLWEAIDSGDILIWIKRAYGITRLVCELCTKETIPTDSITCQRLQRIAQLVSKEIEHNEDNLFEFEDFCFEKL
ncbi:MAG: flagellin lysine-N-methylase [Clostridia bacterium]|nr:flagellin lysine-N-methylase [Clostridia bacterium]